MYVCACMYVCVYFFTCAMVWHVTYSPQGSAPPLALYDIVCYFCVSFDFFPWALSSAGVRQSIIEGAKNRRLEQQQQQQQDKESVGTADLEDKTKGLGQQSAAENAADDGAGARAAAAAAAPSASARAAAAADEELSGLDAVRMRLREKLAREQG